MSGASGISGIDAAAAMLLRAEEGQAAQGVAVLKKALSADKEMVARLLPSPLPATVGRLDIQA